MKIVILFLLIVGIGGVTFAQKGAKLTGQARIDSLLKQLAPANDDTGKVKILNSLAYSSNSIDPVQGMKYAQEAFILSEKLEDKRGLASSYAMLGVNTIALSDYPKALEYFLQALKLSEELQDKKGIASAMGNIGNVYINMGDLNKALEYYLKVLKMFEELNSRGEIAISMANIGNVYFQQNNFPKALEYTNMALKLTEELGDRRGKASNLKSIANVYESLANYPKAMEYDSASLKIFEDIDDKHGMAVCTGSIGECYLTMARDTVKMKNISAAAKAALLQKAILYSKKGIAMCSAIGDLDDMQEFSKNLSDALVLVGNYKEAYEIYKQHVSLYDTVFGQQNNEKMQNLETKREIDIKNKQIEIDKLAIAKKNNERKFYFIGIGVLLLAVAFIFRSYTAQRKTNVQLSDEKQRSEDLLLNILPAEVAEELKNKGSAAARHFDNVTVIFTDFVNFTEAGERMSPQELIAELHACFKAFDNIIGKYNIEKIKTIGDAYLAVCGLPVADPRHAENIVNAALDIQVFMHNRQQEIGNKTFQVRIGIHSGSVVAGIVGVKKFAYDIWGDTVNTGARMEEQSEAGKINISQTTYDLVNDKFTCTYRGEIVAKNKGVMKMYFVTPLS